MGMGMVGEVCIGGEAWTLERVLEVARTNSPDVRIARARLAGARALEEQAGSMAWPVFRVEAGYGVTDQPMRAFGSILNQRAFSSDLDFNRVPATDNLNLRGTVEMPLYTGGRLAAGRESARAMLAASELSAEAVRRTLAFEVERTFYAVQKARALERAAISAVRAYEAHADVARRREGAGTLLRADVLDMEVRLAQAREDESRVRHGRMLTVEALRMLLGMERGEEGFEVSDEAGEDGVEEGGREGRRPELLAAELQVDAAAAQVKAARAGHRPRVSVVGAVDYDHGWRWDGGGDSYSAGVVVQWDAWDGRLTRGRVREAEAAREQAEEEARRWRLALAFELEQARLALADAEERLVVTATVISRAEESATLTRSRFEQGLALASQLTDAETTLTAARVRRAEAEADRRVARAALRRALGMEETRKEP
jgi:outer membrane protein TolC